MEETTSTIDEVKLEGGRKKNGHKSNCACHICENMRNKAKRGGYKEDLEKEKIKQMGGSKKKNGHKPNCKCPICRNMMNAKKTKRGGNELNDKLEEAEEFATVAAYLMGGKKHNRTKKRKGKGNGHKPNCGCPICKNMRKKIRLTLHKKH